jgi:sugar phosphate isomerase/epimerase
MRIRDLHVGYCTNVHPGEGLDEIERMLVRHVAEVKRRVSPGAPFGLGLRLGHAAAATLSGDAARREAFAEQVRSAGLYVFTVNGFPYGDFAADAVKAAVYEPSWLDAERVDYTVRLARALAALPGPDHRTISTVAGCFRGRAHDDAAHARMARHLGEAARALADLADETGVGVRLCLEPEPWTTLETTDDAVRFFGEHLLPQGGAARDHLGLCYDCCHQAVHFEDPADSLARLAAAGVTVGKVQVSSALHLGRPSDPEARAALLRFDEPRYLHQVVGRRADGALLRAVDLPVLRHADADWLAAEAWRCHFHVPIWWEGDGVLGTTRADWEAAVAAALRPDQHLEIETYTWSVIPAADRARLEGGDLHACVASEFAALRGVIER